MAHKEARENTSSLHHLISHPDVSPDFGGYHELFQNLRDGVVTVKLDGSILTCNSAFERITGYSSDELQKMTYVDLTPQKWHAQDTRIVKNQILKTGFSEVYEKEYRRKDGRIVPIELQTYLLNDSSGVPFGMQAIVRDISERKRTEQALQKAEERYRVIVTTAVEGIWVLDQDHRTIFVNAQMAKILGYEPHEMIGHPVDDFLLEEDRIAHHQSMKYRRKGLSERYERRFLRKDGKTRFMLVSGAPLSDEQIGFAGSFAMFSDITYLKNAESEMRTLKDEAESASKLKSEILDVAAHELRTPLTSLKLQAQMFDRSVKEGKQLLPRQSEQLLQQVRRLAALIDNLIDASHLEHGVFPLKLTRINLVPILQGIIDDFKLRAPKRQVTLEAPKQPVNLIIDPIRIGQVLSNILENALKYTPDDSPIEVKVTANPEDVVTSVTDHGPGIPKDQQPSLFSRFYRVQSETTAKKPGLGLGLYICREIMDFHGGTIEVESTLGVGTTFLFTLPARRLAFAPKN